MPKKLALLGALCALLFLALPIVAGLALRAMGAAECTTDAECAQTLQCRLDAKCDGGPE